MNIKESILILLCIVILAGCAGGPRELTIRHMPTAVKPFDYSKNQSFDEYIAYHKKILKKHNLLNRTEQELDNIAPFQMTSVNYEKCKNANRVGVLLIHGLTDTPYLMRDIAHSLIKQNPCTLARSIILPGHGTVPGDLLNVHHNEWIDATHYGINSFPKSAVKNLFIAAFSTGGATALSYADNIHDKNSGFNLKGLILFSPAIRIKPVGGFLANWHKVVSWALPKTAWFDIMDDEDFAKYESFPKNAADQIHLLTKKISLDKKQKIPAPLFVVISDDDDTIDSEKTKKFFNNRADKYSKMLVYKSGINNQQCINKVCVRRSNDIDKNILSFSHTAIPVAPANKHYGEKQNYKSCYHYLEKNNRQYKKCMSNDKNDYKLGEKSISKTEPIRRLTYNPDFDYMAAAMNQFFSSRRNTRND